MAGLPAVGGDAYAGTVSFEVATERARLLPVPEEFGLVETAPGRTTVTLAVIDYRDNDLGNYNEIGVTVFVTPRGDDTAEAGTFITHLPVDQAFTCAAGREIWGFPKTVESISVDYAPDHVTAALHHEGELAFRLRLPRGGEDEMPEMAMVTYTVRDGGPCATRFVQGGRGSQVVVGGAGVELTLGDAPLGQLLARVGLDAADAPVQMTTWTERMAGRFEAPEKLG
jgi:hypothetical protein